MKGQKHPKNFLNKLKEMDKRPILFICAAMILAAIFFVVRGCVRTSMNEIVLTDEQKVDLLGSITLSRSDFIDYYSSADQGFIFSQQNDVQGRKNDLGTRGFDYIQLFGEEEKLELVTLNMLVDPEEGLTSFQLGLAEDFASKADSSFGKVVKSELNRRIRSSDSEDFSIEDSYQAGLIRGRVQCREIILMKYCTVSSAWDLMFGSSERTEEWKPFDLIDVEF